MAATIRKIISTAKAPAALGPYSQAVAAGNTLYVSGCIGVNEAFDLVSPDVLAQTTRALENMREILKAGNSSFDKVVKVTVMLADINDWPAVNNVYTNFFTAPFPARSAYQVAALPKSAKVEIEAVALIGDVIDQ